MQDENKNPKREPSFEAQSGDPAGEAGTMSGSPDSELETLRAKADQYYEDYLRARAEIENVRRRAQDDVAKAHKFGTEAFAESLLSVIDSLEAALADQVSDTQKLREGVELTHRQLIVAFEKNRMVAINPVGEKFDPHKHQAISMIPGTETPPNHVIAVLQKGWTLADRVLRPALVTVAQG